MGAGIRRFREARDTSADIPEVLFGVKVTFKQGSMGRDIPEALFRVKVTFI